MVMVLWHILIVLSLFLAAGSGLAALRAVTAIWLAITAAELATANWIMAPQLLTLLLGYLLCVGRAARASYFSRVGSTSIRPRLRARATAPVGTVSLKGMALGLATASALGALLIPVMHRLERPSSPTETVTIGTLAQAQAPTAVIPPATAAPDAPPVQQSAAHSSRRHRRAHGSQSAWHDMRRCLKAGSDSDITRCSEGVSH